MGQSLRPPASGVTVSVAVAVGCSGKVAVCVTVAPRHLADAETYWLTTSAPSAAPKKSESPSLANDSESVPQQHGKP